MKNTLKYIALAVALWGLTSCEIDNMDGPDAAVKGTIIVQGTGNAAYDGQPLRASQGKDDGKIRVREDSWADAHDNSVELRDWNIMLDGTYQNTKVFSGTYTMYPFEGAFYKLPESEYTKGIRVKGKVQQDFHVTPYLLVDWVKEPYLGPDNKIRATIKFTRVPVPTGKTTETAMPNLQRGVLHVSSSILVSRNTRLNDYFPGNVGIGNDKEGQEIEFVSAIPVKYPNTTYYVRVGVQVNGNSDRQNYTTVFPLKVGALN